MSEPDRQTMSLPIALLGTVVVVGATWWLGRYAPFRVGMLVAATAYALYQVHRVKAWRGSWWFFIAGLLVLTCGLQVWRWVT